MILPEELLPDHLSNSQTELYLSCSFRYLLDRILGLKERRSSPPLILGSAYHAALEYMFSTIISGRKPGLTETRLIAISEYKKAGKEGGVEGTESDLLMRMVEKYHRDHLAWMNPCKVEEHFEIEVPGVDVPFVGIIDLVDDGTLVDHKTSKNPWGKWDAHKKIQATAYIYAYEQLHGERLPFRYDVMVKKDLSFEQWPTKRSGPQLQIWEAGVRGIWEGMKNGIFIRNPAYEWCGSRVCPFWAECKLGKSPGEYIEEWAEDD